MQLTLQNVSFGYSRRRTVLSIPEMHVEQFPLALLGPNGAGKSSLLSLLGGLHAPTAGAVFFDSGDRPRADSVSALRALTTLMTQDPRALRGFTAREHVAYGGWLKGMRYRQAWSQAPLALEKVSLQGLVDRPVHHLSGGQRRRLGIAEALVSEPEVLLLDEPYAGIDPEQRSLLRSTLKKIRQETALIAATHQTEDLDDIYASVAVLDEGKILFSGSTAEFLSGVSTSIPQAQRAEHAYLNVMKGATFEADL